MKVAVLLSLAIFLSGCQSLLIQRTPNGQIDYLIAQDRYDNAMEVAERANEEGIGIDIDRIQALKNDYVELQLHRAEDQAQLFNWFNARSLLTDALRLNPDTPELQTALNGVIQRENNYIDLKIASLGMDEAKFIISTLPVYKDIVNRSQDKLKYSRELFSMERRSQDLSLDLVGYARANFENGQVEIADQALTLAMKLNENIKEVELNLAIKTRLEQLRSTKQANENRVRQRKLTSLSEQFSQAVSNRKLEQAQMLMGELWRLAPDDPVRNQQQNLLNQAINEYIQAGIRRGEQLYNQGQITDAIDAWQLLLVVQPSHRGINQRIERAERFVENIERLKTDVEAFENNKNAQESSEIETVVPKVEDDPESS